jgi:hypothetical protein
VAWRIPRSVDRSFPWEEVIQFVPGVWLAVSVFVLDYGLAAQLRVWHFVTGVLVALMAAIAFWQGPVKKS